MSRSCSRCMMMTSAAVEGDIPINAEGLIELCNLGWLDPKQLRDRRAAADAVIELTNAAIALRLRPNM